MSLGQDCVWFLRWVISAIAGVTTAWNASTAGIFLLTAGTWNAVAQLLGAAMEGGKPARIDSLDSLEFVHFLQTALLSSCGVVPVSPEYLRMHVHANHTCNPHIISVVIACTMVIWSLTTSLASPLLVGRKLVNAELVNASLDIGSSPPPSLGVNISTDGALAYSHLRV